MRQRAFSERIAEIMNRYTNQQLTSAEVIAALVELAKEVAANPKGIDPLFIDLVERWPGRARWLGQV